MSPENGTLAIQRGKTSIGLMNVQVFMPTIYPLMEKPQCNVANICICGCDRVTTVLELALAYPDLCRIDAPREFA